MDITEKQFESQVKDLEELMLIVKKGFKFLNTLLEFWYYQSVLLFRFSKQVRRAIVILYSIVVVNFPSIRDRLAMRLFPDKDVFKNIYSLCSWVFRHIYFNITCLSFKPSTFPMRIFLPFWRGRHLFTLTPLFLDSTRRASSGLHINQLATINARLTMVCSPLLDVFKAFGCINHSLIIS